MRARPAVLALALAVLLVPLGTGVAAAHDGGHGPAHSVARVVALEPAVPGLAVTVIEAGQRLRLDNGTSAPVAVLAPADGAGSDGAWPVVAPGGTARWADPRAVEEAEEGPGTWALTLSVGGQPVTVRGDHLYPPAPATVLWWLAVVVALGAVALLGARAPDRRPFALAVAAATLLVVAAGVVRAVGAALVPEDGGFWPLLLGAAGLGLVAWVVGLAGVVLTVARRPLGLLLCALAGAVLALLTAADTTAFHHAVLLFAGDPALDRAALVLTVGAGAGLFLTGFAVLRRIAP